jgi:hypothetical protein
VIGLVIFLGLLDLELSDELHIMSAIIHDHVFNIQGGFTWLANLLNWHSKEPLRFERGLQANIQETWGIGRDCPQILMMIFLHHNLPLVVMVVVVMMFLMNFSRFKFFRSVKFNFLLSI